MGIFTPSNFPAKSNHLGMGHGVLEYWSTGLKTHPPYSYDSSRYRAPSRQKECATDTVSVLAYGNSSKVSCSLV